MAESKGSHRVAGLFVAPWALATVVVVASWAGGLALWGGPDRFGAVASPMFQYATLVVVGLPSMVVAGALLGWSFDRNTLLRVGAYAVLVLAVLVVGWLASFVHFGGICMDPTDRCQQSWVARAGGLLLALGAVGAGAAAELLMRRACGSARGGALVQPE
ncbi:MAG TPA: hypothetical protein VIY72_11160 [Acidimicrobiales bacterium]